MVRTCPILALAMSYHNLSPSRQKKKRCLGWSWWSWHCTGILRPVKHCFFFLLIWISLWLFFGHLLQWFFVVIAVIIKNPLWLSAVHTGAIDSIKKQPPSCMSAMISILLQSVADEESKKTPHHIFEKNSLMLWLVVTSCCPVLSWCCIITVAIAILYWLAANWWYITTSFSSAFLKLILEYCLTLVSWWYWQSPAAGHCCCFRLEALLTLWRRRKLAVSQEQKQLPPHPRRLVLKYFLSFPRFSVNLSS